MEWDSIGMYTDKWLKDTPNNVAYGHAAVLEPLHGTLLGKMSSMQWILRREDDLMPYVDAIERATDAEIEMARPQLFQALAMVKQFVQDRHYAHYSLVNESGLLNEADSSLEVVDTILEAVTAETREHAFRALKNPSNEDALHGLSCGLRILAEARIVTASLADGSKEHETRWSIQASDAFREVAEQATRLRDSVGSLHRDLVHGIVPDVHVATDDARKSVELSLSNPVEALNFRNVNRTIDITGDWTSGIRIMPNPSNNPLSAHMTNEARNAVAAVLSDYDTVFHRPGFVNLLRQAAEMSRWYAVETADRETVSDIPRAARQARAEALRSAEMSHGSNDLYHKRELAMSLSAREQDIAGRQSQYLGSARRSALLAQDLDSFMARTAAVMGVETPIRSLKAERQGDIVVLRFESPRLGDNALVVYPQQGVVDEEDVDAVFAAIVPDEVASGPLPSYDEIRHAKGTVGTSFHNIEDCANSLNEQAMQEFAFGSMVRLSNPQIMIPVEPRMAVERDEDSEGPGIPF